MPDAVGIVVARYSEDLGWLQQDPIAKYTVVYNKGTQLEKENGWKQVIQAPNVGREAHTYLRYVIDHYDNLPEVILFTQGSIHDHSHVLMGRAPIQAIYGMLREAKSYGKSSNACRVPTHETYCCPTFKLVNYSGKELRDSGKTLSEWWGTYLGSDVLPPSLIVYWNACFAVQSAYILSRPRSYYEKLIECVEDHHSPEEAHFLERAWWYVFQMD